MGLLHTHLNSYLGEVNHLSTEDEIHGRSLSSVPLGERIMQTKLTGVSNEIWDYPVYKDTPEGYD